jgi:hypothetical protein
MYIFIHYWIKKKIFIYFQCTNLYHVEANRTLLQRLSPTKKNRTKNARIWD